MKPHPSSMARRHIGAEVVGGADARPNGLGNLSPQMSTLRSTASISVKNGGSAGVFPTSTPPRLCRYLRDVDVCVCVYVCVCVHLCRQIGRWRQGQGMGHRAGDRTCGCSMRRPFHRWLTRQSSWPHRQCHLQHTRRSRSSAVSWGRCWATPSG
jgi:hypothetical protein